MFAFVTRFRFSRVITAALLACTLFAVTACGNIWGREEFTKEVMDHTSDEVLAVVGKPAVVDSSNPARVTWTYNSVTYDITRENQKDSKALVIFAPDTATGKLKVVDVQYVS